MTFYVPLMGHFILSIPDSLPTRILSVERSIYTQCIKCRWRNSSFYRLLFRHRFNIVNVYLKMSYQEQYLMSNIFMSLLLKEPSLDNLLKSWPYRWKATRLVQIIPLWILEHIAPALLLSAIHFNIYQFIRYPLHCF